MNINKKPHLLGILGVLFFLLVPLPSDVSIRNSSLNFEENNFLLTPKASQNLDFVDNIFQRRNGFIGNFDNMRQNNPAYTILTEQQFIFNTWLLDLTFIFQNVNFNYDVAELHIVLSNSPRDNLQVSVGSSIPSLSQVGMVDNIGDNSFNVKQNLNSPIFLVKLTDLNVNNLGPYLIQKMYLLQYDHNSPPSVNAGIDRNVNEGDPLIFSGFFSDPDLSDIHTIEWNFGEGNTASGTLTPSHIYEDNGVYTASLTVNDNQGGITSDFLTVSVNNLPPIVEAGPDQTVFEGQRVFFSGAFTDPGIKDTHNKRWDFGDGSTTSGTLNPRHTYNSEGVYLVTLTVTDNDGATSSDVLFITVNQLAPLVTASGDQITDEGSEMSLIVATFTNPGPFVSHTAIIDWGDGTIGPGVVTEPTVLPMMLLFQDNIEAEGDGTVSGTHVYGDNGEYTVTITVTDNDGESGSDTLLISVNNVAPDVEAGGDQVVDEGDLVSFSGSFTDPGSLDTHTIIWDFGDGNTYPNTLTPAHIYEDNGMYTVMLTVTDDDGASDTDSLLITVSNLPPMVIAGADQVVDEGETVSFNGNIFDFGGLDTHTIIWDFGDGNTATDTLTPTHVYGDNDLYIVILTVTDDDGGVGTDSLTVTVNNEPPIVSPGDNLNVEEGEIISFSGSFTDPGSLDTHTIEWDFGDGNTATGTLTPTHAYGDNGKYRVKLRVVDDDGGVDSDTLLVIVNNVAPIVQAGEDKSVDEGESISFSGSFSDPGNLDTHSIIWDFGDGNIAIDTLNPSYTYEDNGVYTVTLTVTDDDGAIGYDTLVIIVNNVAPTVQAGGDQNIDEGETISFSGSFSDPGSLDTHTLEWDFGDGNTATGTLTPTHTYGDNGVYTVTLTITDNDGGVGSGTVIITVNNVAPSVDIKDFHLPVYDTVNVTGSANDQGSDDLTFTWSWGDGTPDAITLFLNNPPSFPVSIEENLEHTYSLIGEFVITLTVMDDDGGIGEDSIIIIVSNPRDLKLSAISDLELLKTGYKCFDKKIDHVIKFIEMSLCEQLWIDSSHLNPHLGGLVFIFEMIAVKYLQKFAPTELIEGIIIKLAKADEVLAKNALEEAKNIEVINPKFQWKYDYCISKADEHISEAAVHLENQEYLCAMVHYYNSWKYAQRAERWANKEHHWCTCD
ncbi:MAG: PKD domain-containing protein [Promethearchaeota archaeon]